METVLKLYRFIPACLLLLTACLGGCVKIHMPGKTFAGPLPPLSAEQAQLSARLRGHVQVLGGDIGERNVYHPQALEAAAAYIEGQFANLGYQTGRQEYEVEGVRVRNIDVNIPGVPGAARADEIVVVGAHYDSARGAPGANDNASGVAAVLEIARTLRDRKLARTVRYVAFVNEEPPFFQTDQMGSVVYARRCRERGERVVAMLTPETIGCYSDEKKSQHYPSLLSWFYPSVGNFIAFVGESESGRLVARCVQLFREHAKFPSEGGAAPKSIEGVGWSDHWSFSRQGYPGLMITDTAPFRYAHYHTAQDTPDKCDYDRMARVVEGVARVIEDLANQERTP
jgi:Zn-dependent M28 family amino/carboxypeptidase